MTATQHSPASHPSRHDIPGTEAGRPFALLFINALSRGGAETQLVRLARGLREHGYRVEICVIQPGNDFAGELAGIPVTLLSPRPGVSTFRAAIREVRRGRPDVVINFLYQATLVGRVAALAGRVSVVISSMRNERLETRLRSLLFRATSIGDDAIVTNSQRARQTLEDAGTVRRGTTIVIPNALDPAAGNASDPVATRAALGIEPGTTLFVGAGRLAPQKDWATLVEAAALYSGPPARWLIAGSGDLEGELRRLIAQRDLTGTVTLLGLRHDVPDLLAAADALVLSSHYEGLPNIVLEALALGTPVIATAVGACPDLVADDAGFLVPPRRPDELARAMEKLALLDPADRAAMGAAGRARIDEQYSAPAVMAQWCRLVDGLLAERRA